MKGENDVRVEVVFITPPKQFLRTLNVPQGTTIQQAIRISCVQGEFPGTDFDQLKTGIYSKIKAPDTVLRELDRLEIYRPLEVDPMLARRRRADKKGRLTPR